jgi:RNA polymerase sigma-70 factor (ECF subfamily)
MSFPSTPADPESNVTRSQVRRILEAAIDKLPPAFRIVFVLRAIEEMSIEEIACELGITEATVRTRMHSARALLGPKLEKKLGTCAPEIFSFAGQRCEQLRERVLARIKELDKAR